jgi:hypothetical protein
MPLLETSAMTPEDTSLKPQFFISRPNGNMVPVIPIDEIPTNVVIQGVPRVLAAKDLAGMTSIGEHESRHAHYEVEFVGMRNHVFDPQTDRTTAGTTNKLVQSAQAELIGLIMDDGYHSPRKAYGIEERGTSTNTVSRSTSHQTSTSSNISDPKCEANVCSVDEGLKNMSPLRATGTKEYCSFWLRRGECDYAQQGCLYKHEMPKDVEGLERVGLRDFPQWYRDMYKVRSLLAVPGSGAAGGPTNISRAKLDSSWRSPSRSVSMTYAAGVTNEPAQPDSTSSSNRTVTSTPTSGSIRTPARASRASRAISSGDSTPAGRRRGQPKIMGRDRTAAINAVSSLNSDSDELPHKNISTPASGGRGQHYYVKPTFMTLDDLAAKTAIKQLEESEAEEVKRNAKLTKYPVPYNPDVASTADDNRPSSRDSDESIDHAPGVVTPASSTYDSDPRASKTNKTKIANAAATSDPSTARSSLDVNITRYNAGQAEGRQQAVRVARNKLEAVTTKRCASIKQKPSEVRAAIAAAERERQRERDLIQFGIHKESEDMEGWRPDHWDHDD